MVLLCIGSHAYFWFVLSFLSAMSVLFTLGFWYDPYHHHNLQSECHLQCWKHWVVLGRPHWSFVGSCHLLAIHQMVVWWIRTCQIDMQMWFNTVIICHILGCSNLNSHLVILRSMHLLDWAICCWQRGLCVSALLVPISVVLGPGTDGLCHLAWVLLWSCCSILQFHLTLVAL